jgi:hypothetical protein
VQQGSATGESRSPGERQDLNRKYKITSQDGGQVCGTSKGVAYVKCNFSFFSLSHCPSGSKGKGLFTLDED